MKSIKTMACAALAATMLMSSCPIVMADDISVMLDGQELYFDVEPQIVNDSTMVPMRTIFEALNYDVSWDGETQRIIAYNPYNGIALTLTIGYPIIRETVSDNYSYVVENANNLPYTDIPVAPMIVDGTTLVPIRAVSEGAKCSVIWDATNRIVNITSPSYNTSNDGKSYADATDGISTIKRYIDNGMYLEAIDLANEAIDIFGTYNTWSPQDIQIVNRLKSMAEYRYNEYVNNSESTVSEYITTAFDAVKNGIVGNGVTIDSGYGILFPYNSGDVAFLYQVYEDKIVCILELTDTDSMIFLELYNNGSLPTLGFMVNTGYQQLLGAGSFDSNTHRFMVSEYDFGGIPYETLGETVEELINTFLAICDTELGKFVPDVQLSDFGIVYDPIQ